MSFHCFFTFPSFLACLVNFAAASSAASSSIMEIRFFNSFPRSPATNNRESNQGIWGHGDTWEAPAWQFLDAHVQIYTTAADYLLKDGEVMSRSGAMFPIVHLVV